MLSEDYVSYETAKLLKEKGFDVKGAKVWYDESGEMYYDRREIKYQVKIENHEKFFQCPTLQMAMKWLRETYNIGIFPSLFAFCVGEGGAAKPTYGTKIISLKSCELLTDDINPMPTYEQACEAAIKYCLENLI